MATSLMENARTMGDWGTGQSVPFTALSDGFVSIYINPSSGSGANGQFRVGRSDGAAIYVYLCTPTGNGVTNCVPIKKGEQVTQLVLNNANATVYFRPFEWT